MRNENSIKLPIEKKLKFDCAWFVTGWCSRVVRLLRIVGDFRLFARSEKAGCVRRRRCCCWKTRWKWRGHRKRKVLGKFWRYSESLKVQIQRHNVLFSRYSIFLNFLCSWIITFKIINFIRKWERARELHVRLVCGAKGVLLLTNFSHSEFWFHCLWI